MITKQSFDIRGMAGNLQFNILSLMFGFEEMIKEEYALGSLDYEQSLLKPDRQLFNHCLTTFYDQDSNENIIQSRCSVQEVICYLEHTIDLIDTPLAEILEIVRNNATFRGIDEDLLRRRLMKHKNLLKRSRAKNRKMIPRECRVVKLQSGQEEQQQEFKKQRNRISAQISRDRKKEKMMALEKLNRQLEEECKQQKFENQRLRQLAQQNSKPQPLKSRFTKMLILLGIIFLFGIIRDIFQGSESTKTITKIQESTRNLLGQSCSEYHLIKPEHNSLVALQIEQTLTQSIENPSVVERIKGTVLEKLSLWRPGGLFARDTSLLQGVKTSID